MSLMPTLIERYARIKDADKLKEIGFKKGAVVLNITKEAVFHDEIF